MLQDAAKDAPKTPKSRSDNAVQGTNDSSIVSKCSMVTHGYFKDKYVCHFVAKQSRRSSLINKGYYIRAKAIDHVLKLFLFQYNGKHKQIISLGAGFDSAFFRLKTEGLLEDTTYVEVDFPDVICRKVDLIQNHHQLKVVLRNELEIPQNLQKLKDVCPMFSSPGYHIIGCDLKQVAKLTSCLQHCDIDYQEPTLLLSECVITYMGSKSSNPLIHWAAESFPDSVFVSYEQIYPNDAFGKVMCGHFKKIGSPLKSIEKYPTPGDHQQRYCKLGWSSTEYIDMNDMYYNILAREETKRIEDLELFDEYEEFHSMSSHYMVCCAYNGRCQDIQLAIHKGRQEEELNDDCEDEPNVVACSSFQNNIDGTVRRYGHTSTKLTTTKFLLIGGFGVTSHGHAKISQVQILDTEQERMIVVENHINETLDLRMHHTATRISTTQVIIFGGRTSPAKPLSSSYVLTIEEAAAATHYSCRRLQCSVEPQPRWRHSAVLVNTKGCQKVAIYAGKSVKDVLDDLWLMDVDTNQWTEVTLSQPTTPARHSHSTCTWRSSMLTTGGLDGNGHVLGGIHIINTDNWTWKKMSTKPEIKPRYSHTSHVTGDILLLAGGLSLSSRPLGITSVHLLTGSVHSYSLMVDKPEHPIMLFKMTSELLEGDSKLVVFGGGGNCFSFGTHFNSTPICIDIGRVIENQ